MIISGLTTEAIGQSPLPGAVNSRFAPFKVPFAFFAIFRG
jgi:hypothetical protein